MLGDVVDSRVGHEASDRGVGTPSIVELDVAAKGMESLAVRAVGSGVGPLIEQGPDEALGLAVGLGPERPGSLVTDITGAERIAIGVAAIARPVVGQDPLDRDANLGEAGNRQLTAQAALSPRSSATGTTTA